MPIYEYECKDCSEKFEIKQSFSDSPMEVCQKCSGELRQTIFAPAVHFKGTGWYVTDYKDKDKGNKKEKSVSNEKSSTKKSEPSASKNCEKNCPAACSS